MLKQDVIQHFWWHHGKDAPTAHSLAEEYLTKGKIKDGHSESAV